MTRLLAALALVLLAACGGEPLRVGAKDAPENRILANMIAILLEERGLAVERRIPIGDTARAFAALQRGGIDVYPEYAGTGLSLLGQPPVAEPEAAMAAARAAFAESGLTWLAPFGFEAGYAVLTTPAVAARHSLRTFADLTEAAPSLRLGVTETFARRTGDGMTAWLERYGLAFGGVEITPRHDRGPLFDALAAGAVDVIVAVTTDPQMDMLAPVALIDADGFFPAYPAAPLAREAAAARAPALTEVAGMLAGRLDAATMRGLSAAVAAEGLSPRQAAQRGLVALGLLERSAIPEAPPFLLAVAPADRGGAAAGRALLALRAAVQGRRVEVIADPRPLTAMLDGEARLSLSPAIAHYEVTDARAALSPKVEATAVVGSAFLHALARADGPTRLAEARRIGTGPAGSPSHKLATAMAPHLGGAAEIVALADGGAESAAAALAAGRIDAGLILAEVGRADLVLALTDPDLTLLDAASWWRGAARLALPMLREARLPGPVYGPALRDLRTLSMQMTLAGPTAYAGDALGRSGPSVHAPGPEPLTRPVARRLAAALPDQEAVSPHLRPAAVLTPEPVRPRSDVGFSPDRGLLFLVIAAYVIWACWLTVRPGRKGAE